MTSGESPSTPDLVSYADYEARSRATQQHILNAAVEVLIEVGYSGASTLRIQQRAGVTRGRLLHQYPHRDALLVAAVQHIAEARVASLRDIADWPRDLGARCDAAIDALWSTYHQGFFWAATELWLAARYNAKLAEALAPRERALGAAIRAAHDEMFGSELRRRPHYAELREVLNTSMRGAAMTYAFEPRDPQADSHLQTWKTMARRELGLST
jgi:AcrR family transcriptional regulator